MTTIHIHFFPGVVSRVVLSALEEAGLAYTYRCVNFRRAEQTSDAYLAINPKGRVPSVEIDGQVLTETPAILWCLHTLHPEAGLLPRVENPMLQHGQLAELCWMSNTVQPILRQMRQPGKWTLGDTKGVEEDGQAKFHAICRILGTRLAAQDYWHGQHWSIMDVYAFWAYNTAARMGFPMQDYPALVGHEERVRARSSFRRALALEKAVAEQEKIEIAL